MKTRRNNDRVLLESLIRKYGKNGVKSAISHINESKSSNLRRVIYSIDGETYWTLCFDGEYDDVVYLLPTKFSIEDAKCAQKLLNDVLDGNLSEKDPAFAKYDSYILEVDTIQVSDESLHKFEADTTGKLINKLQKLVDAGVVSHNTPIGTWTADGYEYGVGGKFENGKIILH